MKVENGYCFVKPDGTYMGRGSHQTMVGINNYWYPVKDIDYATVFAHPRVLLAYPREDGFPKEGLNAVTVKVTRIVELTSFGVQE